jgi:hypothetical protein
MGIVRQVSNTRTKAVFYDKGMDQIRKLSPSDKQVFIDLAPYHGGSGTLHLLHLADLQRKHRPLNVHTAEAGTMTLGGFSLGRGSRVENCFFNNVYIQSAEFHTDQNLGQDAPGKIQLLATGIPTRLRISFNPRLAFGSPDEILGLDVVKSLQRWIDEATDLVALFDA